MEPRPRRCAETTGAPSSWVRMSLSRAWTCRGVSSGTAVMPRTTTLQELSCCAVFFSKENLCMRVLLHEEEEEVEVLPNTPREICVTHF